jgi:hypothetical protein
MSDPATAQPGQTGKGDALDASAKSKASNEAAGKSTLPCQKPWTLHVLAMTKNKEKGTGTVLIEAGKRSASVPFWVKKQYTETLGATFTDRGTETFDITASAEDWLSEGKKTVTLNNGDEKSEVLVLRPRPWIAFQFVDQKTGKDVPDVQLSLKLPRKGDTEETYTKGVLKIPGLDPGTGEVKKALHAEVWSAEKVEEV